MPGPAFHITTDNVVTDPRLARERTRGLGQPGLEDMQHDQGTIDKSEGYLRFPDDAVLLMIGNTEELLDACETAFNAGILMIGTSNDRTLTLLFVRIEITWLVQTDTLIAIGSDRGWLPAPQRDQWRRVTGRTDTNYVTTRSQNEALTQTRALPDMITEIKERFNKPWIKANP